MADEFPEAVPMAGSFAPTLGAVSSPARVSEKQLRLSREAALKAVEVNMAAQPEEVRLKFARARLLTELGRNEEAKLAYVEILTKEPTHFVALNNIGTLLHKTSCRKAARTAYAQAVKCHPNNPLGHANLAHVLSEMGEMELARRHYETALAIAPDQLKAHQGLANLLILQGDMKGAKVHRDLGFKDQAVRVIPYHGEAEPIRLLVLVSADGGNVPLQRMMDDPCFQRTEIVTEFYDLAQPLPGHQLVINSIGDADLCAGALEAAKKILAKTTAPVINPPEAVRRTGRTANAERLAAIPGVVMPRTRFFAREKLLGREGVVNLAENRFTFPLLLRTPGHHMGRHFIKVEDGKDLENAVESLPGEELAVIQYLDARSRDGKIRKYRVMMIGGRLYPLHAAISRDWKIHYFSAEMTANAEHRAEDGRFLADMAGVLGAKAMGALEGVRETLGLDYAGVDFSLGANGEVLLFETNATMNIVPPGPQEMWAYRRGPIQKATDAVRTMLAARARTTVV